MTGTRPGGDLWRRGSRARRWGRGDVGAEVERVVGDHWVSFRRRAPAGGTIHRKTVEVFRCVGAGPVVHRLAPYRLDREAAGEMDIENIEVFIGTGRR